jgi:oligopeptide transport system substrate-binding protein
MACALRSAVLVLLVLSLGAGLSACSKTHHAQRAPCPAGQLCFEAGNDADPTSLDPPRTELTGENNILQDMFVGLVTGDAAFRPIPGMATSWSTSPDGLVWTFKLREAQWSDGAPVTANDFAFAFRRLEDPKTASSYAYLFYLIKGAEAVNGGKAALDTLGVKAPDPHTFQITLNHPAPYLPEMLMHQIVMPVPEHVVKRWGDAWVQPAHMVANGAYTLTSWTLGDRIVLQKNPRFYDAAHVCLDRVSYYPTPDHVSAERQVRVGELDMTTDFASSRAKFLRRPDQIPAYVHTPPWLGVQYLTFNTHIPALADQRVRLALSMAVDRDFITRKLLGAGQPTQYNFVPKGTANYAPIADPVWATWPLVRRQAEARRLLAAAGYGPAHPLKFELKYRHDDDGDVASLAMQSDWSAIGVKAALAPVEAQIFYQDLNIRDFEVGYAAWIADFNDPLTFLGLFKSDAGSQNYSDYKSASYDALLAQADQQTDLAARAALLEKAEVLPMQAVTVAPIYGYATRALINPAITGWVDNLPGYNPKRWVCFKDAAARRGRP